MEVTKPHKIWINVKTYLIVFQFLDSISLFFLSLGLDCVRPLLNTCLGELLKLLTLRLSHRPVVLLIVSLPAL